MLSVLSTLAVIAYSLAGACNITLDGAVRSELQWEFVYRHVEHKSIRLAAACSAVDCCSPKNTNDTAQQQGAAQVQIHC